MRLKYEPSSEPLHISAKSLLTPLHPSGVAGFLRGGGLDFSTPSPSHTHVTNPPCRTNISTPPPALLEDSRCPLLHPPTTYGATSGPLYLDRSHPAPLLSEAVLCNCSQIQDRHGQVLAHLRQSRPDSGTLRQSRPGSGTFKTVKGRFWHI